MRNFKGYLITLFFITVIFSCTDSTTDDVTTENNTVADPFFSYIPKTKFTGKYDTLGYTFLFNTISQRQYESLIPAFPNKDSLVALICKEEGGCMEKLEAYYISKVAGKVKRQGRDLILSLTNGKTSTLKNNPSEDEKYEVYQFIKLDQNGYFIIAVYYMDSDGYLLVNSANGYTMRTIGYPVFSPNKKRYVAGNYDMMMPSTYNGIELMAITGDCMTASGNCIASIAKVDFKTWGPEEVKWKDDSTLYVRQKSQMGGEAKPENNFAALRIRKK
jgi:hypothetical protein